MCGKDLFTDTPFAGCRGSPPHVRERLPIVRAAFAGGRITPACAGKTRLSSGSAILIRDHPRMCGKDPIPWQASARPSGSPPHVRERHFHMIIMRWRDGITPACAGKTYGSLFRFVGGKDHPRMCGKDSEKWLRLHGMIGSPPHVRERLPHDFILVLRLRITPACAGKTVIFRICVKSMGDHPRMCGKDAASAISTLQTLGSPPHVRERQ